MAGTDFVTRMVIKTRRQIAALEEKLKYYEDKLTAYREEQKIYHKNRYNGDKQ